MNIRIVIMILGIITISSNAFAVTLKEHSNVSDDVIRLSDLFHDIKSNADRVLGASPRPGQEMIINARTLQRVSIALGIDWRPSSIAERVVITREATIIKQDKITEKIKRALIDKIGTDNFKLSLTSAHSQIVLPPSMPADFEIQSLDINHESNWFEAKIAAPSVQNAHTSKVIMGKIKHMTQVPALKTSLRNGNVITLDNIQMIDVPTSALNQEIYLIAQDLIGLTPKRVMAAGSIIKVNDLQEPRVVSRGENVTILYQQGPLILTATGKAMQNGYKGEMIRVTNAQSSKTVDAFVSGYQEVTVRTF